MPILFLIAAFYSLVVMSCKEPPPEPKPPDPVGDFFDEMMDGFDGAMAESVIVIMVNDAADAGETMQRQVLQEIHSQLYLLETVRIIPAPQSQINAAFEQYDVEPMEGIAPEGAVSLALEFQADSLLYASIESKAPDVYFQLYSGDSGDIVFSKTLSAWELPITEEEVPFDPLLGLDDPLSEPVETVEETETTETGTE